MYWKFKKQCYLVESMVIQILQNTLLPARTVYSQKGIINSNNLTLIEHRVNAFLTLNKLFILLRNVGKSFRHSILSYFVRQFA